MADIEKLQIVEPSQVSDVNLLKFVVADVNPAYAFAEEEIGETRDVVVTEIYARKLNHFGEEIFVGLVSDDEVSAEVEVLKVVEVDEFFAKTGYLVARHR